MNHLLESCLIGSTTLNILFTSALHRHSIFFIETEDFHHRVNGKKKYDPSVVLLLQNEHNFSKTKKEQNTDEVVFDQILIFQNGLRKRNQ